jgi:hypothetical protein
MINATIDYDDSALNQLAPSELEFLFSSYTDVAYSFST